jgi:hypothetical protein
MMKSSILLCLSLLLLPLSGFSADKTFLCEAPQGTRIDYFSHNNINLQNETFLMGRDRVSGMRPMIILSDNNKEVSFVIGDASQMNSTPKTGKMNVLVYDENQISFTGIVNGAPILATYYQKMGILIYSQQSIWPGPDYVGARAVIFYAKCAAKV